MPPTTTAETAPETGAAGGGTGARVALVTGCSTGIGEATARALVRAGFITYATARRPETLSDLAASGCRTLRLDVTGDASMTAAVEAIEEEHGAVSLLVNNAGYGQFGPVEEVALDAWRNQFEVNVFGLVRLSQLVLPEMRRQGRGRIVNVGSMGGEFTTPLGGAYHASKYAVEAISDALRFEAAPFGVDVVLIQPGPVKTPFGEASIEGVRTLPGSPYESMAAGFERVSRRTYDEGRGCLSADQVAAVVLRAAVARQPRTRYKIGAAAHLMPFLRHTLTDRAWDALLGRMFGRGVPAGR